MPQVLRLPVCASASLRINDSSSTTKQQHQFKAWRKALRPYTRFEAIVDSLCGSSKEQQE
jgi:hypothetical protein